MSWQQSQGYGGYQRPPGGAPLPTYGQVTGAPAGGYGHAPAPGYGQAPGAGYGHGPGGSYGAPPPAQAPGYGAPHSGPAYGPSPSFQPSSNHPGQYGGAVPSHMAMGGHRPPPPGVDPTLWQWFQAVDQDSSGEISAIELQQALVNANWSHFNPETCRLMIGMFDHDRSGTIDVREFAALWKYINDWKSCFDRFDTDRSGTIDCNELYQAFSSFGYRLSMSFCQLCVRRFDRTSASTMKFDDFIQCCVMLQSLTEGFRKRDAQRAGVVTMNYEDFLTLVLDTSVV